MVLQSNYPPDIRVKKEADSLLNAGHDVTLLCRSVSSLGSEEEDPSKQVVDGVRVYRINDWAPYSKLIWQQLNFDIRFRKPIWENAIESIVANEEIDVFHVHDLPAVKSTLAVAEKYNIPVIADFHEIYPAAMKEWRKAWGWEKKLFNNIISKPIRRYESLEHYCINQVNHIITISDEAKQYYISKYGLAANDVTVVSNMVDLDSFDIVEHEGGLKKYEDDFVVTYVGTYGPHRGLEIAIQALPEIMESVPNVRLVIVGKAGVEQYDRKLRQMASDLKVMDRITFTGWVDICEVPSYMTASDVALVLHNQSDHTDVAVPHKLSQYMATGIPVIVTNRPSLEKIISDASCGLVISYDASEFSDAIIKLASDEQKKRRFGENARQAAIQKYNWSNQANNLIYAYDLV